MLKRPSNFFLIQTLGIEVPILPGSQTPMHPVPFSYYLLFEFDSSCEKRSDSEKNFSKLETRSTFYQKLDS